MTMQYSVILGFMGQLKDRFAFYHQERTLDEKIACVSQVQGVTGVEITYPNELQDVSLAKALLAKHHLSVSAVNVNIKADPRWHQGALTSRDKATRAEAVQWIQQGMDAAAILGSNLVTVAPLADGHDYPFEVDYGSAWRWFVEGMRAAADHRPDVRLSMEYKASEPRARVVLGNVGKALYACAEIDRPNVGVTLDMGHALYTGESFAESVALLADAGKLFLLHGNDNYRNADWDLIPGFVNLWDLIEGTFYVNKAKYDGWLAFDVFPARLDPVETMRASFRMFQLAERMLEQIGQDRLESSIATKDVIQTMALLEENIFRVDGQKS
jgi:xylose isomerase